MDTGNFKEEINSIYSHKAFGAPISDLVNLIFLLFGLHTHLIKHVISYKLAQLELVHISCLVQGHQTDYILLAGVNA